MWVERAKKILEACFNYAKKAERVQTGNQTKMEKHKLLPLWYNQMHCETKRKIKQNTPVVTSFQKNSQKYAEKAQKDLKNL